ncbi:hypothetical protein F0562_011678 [Nyssa sinensis]|uniref:Uncharacterized protein n=1 Tax=Nyssa sinensis TaxID=561372 RepID=A0A5J4ZT65_9ASTE|nr:hypothetical protein F0562_011678 [Nyssa sinensis]
MLCGVAAGSVCMCFICQYITSRDQHCTVYGSTSLFVTWSPWYLSCTVGAAATKQWNFMALGGFKDYNMLLAPIGRSNLSISVYGIEIIIINWESCMFIIVPGIIVQLAIVDFRGIVYPEVALGIIVQLAIVDFRGIVYLEVALGTRIIAVGELKLRRILFSVLVASFIVEDMYYRWSTSCSSSCPM